MTMQFFRSPLARRYPLSLRKYGAASITPRAGMATAGLCNAGPLKRLFSPSLRFPFRFSSPFGGVRGFCYSSCEEKKDGPFEFDDVDLESDESLWNLYQRWMTHYHVYRDPSEQQARFKIFKQNAFWVHRENQIVSFDVGLTQFSDMTDREIRTSLLLPLFGLVKKKEPKTSSLGKLEANLDQRTETMSARTGAYESKANPLSYPYSIDACMDLLDTLENVPDPLYQKALRIFKDSDWRRMFIKMPHFRRKGWLESLELEPRVYYDPSF